MIAPERKGQFVDATTGEVLEFCPDCQDKDDAIKQYEKQARILNSRLTRLERNAEAEAMRHKRWDEAEALHEWWRLATGHFKAEFSLKDFQDMLPRLKEKGVGAIGFLHAVAGVAFDPSERPMANGRIERYDSIELVCRSAAKLESFQNRAPGDPDDETGAAWKRFLIDRIESNLTTEEDK